MAPEPYPQVKWTREQEEAYAEGRKSAQKATRSQQGPSSSGRRRRVVRTAEGARRYGVPIGSEIGTARNAEAGKAQQDTESTGRYNDLVGQDQKAQSDAMRGLNDDQLQRLSRVAYSWKSSDPNVVRLRIGVANELKRRGFNVNDFGGLGPKSAAPPKPAAAAAPKKAKAKKADPLPVTSKQARAHSALIGSGAIKNRKARELSVPQLRQALSAVGKLPQDKRPTVARYLVRKAIELGVPHFLGQSVIELAGHSRAEAIELAGKWRHGYIPLDTTALSSKMKGRTGGKQWWVHGESGSEGGGRNIGKKLRAVPKSGSPDRIPGVAPGHEFRKQGDGKYASYQGGRKPRNKLDQGLDVNGVQQVRRGRASAGKPYKVPHHTQTRRSEEYSFKPRVKQEAPKRKPGVSGKKGSLTKSIEAGKQVRASRSRTSVVKSSPKPERGSKMTPTLRTKKPVDQLSDRELRSELSRAETMDQRRPTEGWDMLAASLRGKLGTDQKGHPSRTIASRPEHIKMAGDAKLRKLATGGDANAKAELDARKKYRASRAAPASRTGAAEPFPSAANYLEMHGTAKTREKLDKLKAKRDGLKAMRRKTTSVDLEIKGLENVLARDSDRRFQAQKNRSRLTPEQLAKRGFTGNGGSGKA